MGVTYVPRGKKGERKMADQKERMTKLAEAADADKDFADAVAQAVVARDFDEVSRLAAEKGIQLESEDFEIKEIDGVEVDDAELEAVAGGGAKEKADARYAQCQTTSCVLCGLGAAFAIW